jgi:hypothetical protein
MNNIPERQNEDRMLALLRARRALYRNAKNWQGAVVWFTLLLPIANCGTTIWGLSLTPLLAVAALLFGLVEILFIDSWLKRRLAEGAKLQEEFDCEVLGMHWNELVAGKKVDHERVHSASRNRLDSKSEQQLRDWYPTAVGRLPLHLARVLCQRENLMYDGKVRDFYSYVLAGGAFALFGGALAYGGLAAQLRMSEWVVGILAPAIPALMWAAREFRRQRNTVESLEVLKAEADKLWKKAEAGGAPDAISATSRELQNALYNHRISSPLIFDFLYRFRRKGLEDEMNAGALHHVDRYAARGAASAQFSNPPDGVR